MPRVTSGDDGEWRSTAARPGRVFRAGSAAGWGLALAAAVLVGWPVVMVLSRPGEGGGAAEVSRLLPGVGGAALVLGRSVLVALGVGVAATIIALPAGWVLRRRTRVGAALVVTPLLMPGYLAYASYSTLRENDTWIGDWLGTMPTGFNAALGRWLAMGGVVLWAWPIAAVVLGMAFSAVSPAVLDALRMDGGGRLRRGLEVAKVCRWGLARAVLAVGLVTLGSAVPLHLAQVETYAIALWKMLDLQAPARAVWLAASPLVLIGLLAAWWVGRGVRRAGTIGDERGFEEDAWEAKRSGGDAWAWGLALAAWAASVPVPVALYGASLRDWGLVSRFWQEHGDAVQTSLLVSTGVAGIGVVLAMLAWRGAERGARVAWWSLWVFVAAGLVPGVLIGGAWSACGRVGAGGLGESAWVVVMAHAARFGFVGVLAGWLLERAEGRATRESRWLDGGDGLKGWWLAAGLPRARFVAGAALAMAALSFHEIESAVILQPAGTDSLARVLLDNLHYLRDQKIAAAVVNLMVAATGLALAAGWLLAPGRVGMFTGEGAGGVRGG